MRTYLQFCRERLTVLIATLVLVPTFAVLVSFAQGHSYEASAQLLPRPSTLAGDTSGLQSPANLLQTERRLQTQAELAATPIVAQRVLAATPGSNSSIADFLDSSTVTTKPSSGALVFTVENSSAPMASRLADEYARQTARYEQDLASRPIRRALDVLETNTDPAVRARLGRKEGRLQIEEALAHADGPVLDPAEDAERIRPQPLQEIGIGLLLGLLLGLGLAYLWESLEPRLRSAAAVSEALGLRLVARGPVGRRRRVSGEHPDTLIDPFGPEIDRILASGAPPGPARLLTVASAYPGEGRATVAADLALAFARAGRRVVLVELDLRDPSQAQRFRLRGDLGLTDVAAGSATLDQAMERISPLPQAGGAVRNGGGALGGELLVLAAGSSRRSDSLTGPAFESVLVDLRTNSDVVIIDAPPLLIPSSTSTLGHSVDTVLLVVRSGALRWRDLEDLKAVVATNEASKPGFVLTDVPGSVPGERGDRSYHPSPARARSSVHQVLPWLAVCATAALVGTCIALEPPIAFAVVALVLMLAVGARVALLPLTVVLGAAIMISSAFGDLIGRLHAGPISANGGLTAAYALIAALILVAGGLGSINAFGDRAPGPGVRPLIPLLGLLLLAVLSLAWGGLTILAVQSIFVLFLFVASILCGAAITTHSPDPIRFATRVLGFGAIVALALYGASLAVGGVGSGAVVGNRTFALFAIILIAWGVAGWRYHARWARVLTIITGIFIVSSLSRIALAAALVICCLVWFNPRTIAGWLRMLGVVALAVAFAYFLVTTVQPIHDRIYEGDVQSIGSGISLNLTGRDEYWSTTWDSFKTSPYLGHGAGSAAELITSVYSAAIGHPHNDYLRLLHDYGLIGAVLWVIGYGSLMARTWRSWQARRRHTADGEPAGHQADELRIHAAAFLALLGVAIAMITDNPIDYLFVMAPLGILVGLSLGLGSPTRRVGDRPRPQPATPAAPEQAVGVPS